MKKKHEPSSMVPMMPTPDERLRYAAAEFARSATEADPKVRQMRNKIERDVLAVARRRRKG